mgnify:CR=1 FL=1
MTRFPLSLLMPVALGLWAVGCGGDGSDDQGAASDAAQMAQGSDGGADPVADAGSSTAMDATADESDGASPDAQNPDMMADPDGAIPQDMRPIPDYEGPRKKGIAVTQGTYDWSYVVSSMKPFWSYSWGLTLSRYQPDGVEFVPMQWCCSLGDDTADRLRAQFAAGEIKYLLGYNEPDSATQANMTVDRAIVLWRQLEATGIPLVSPSPVHFDNEWTEAFMERALAEGLRIDYLGYHSYGGPNAQWLLDKLDALYAQYQIPIWITEFAVADWNAETREANRIQPEAVLEFMREILPELDRRDHIFRYAWYTDYSSQHLWPSALFGPERELTPLGEFYAQHTPNPAAGPPKPFPVTEPDPSNLLQNGGFELGGRQGWGGYENRVLTIDNAAPHDGVFLGMLRGGLSSAFDQRVTLQAGVTYRVTVHSRWSDDPGRDVGAVMEEADTMARTSGQLSRDTQWQETTFTVTPEQTQDYIFWIWTGEGIAANLYLDTMSIRAE